VPLLRFHLSEHCGYTWWRSAAERACDWPACDWRDASVRGALPPCRACPRDGLACDSPEPFSFAAVCGASGPEVRRLSLKPSGPSGVELQVPMHHKLPQRKRALENRRPNHHEDRHGRAAKRLVPMRRASHKLASHTPVPQLIATMCTHSAH
jgi:hypothetical protein